MCEGFLGGDSPQFRRKKDLDVKFENDPVNFDKSSNAVGPLVAPATFFTYK